jgi:hypothetical protein
MNVFVIVLIKSQSLLMGLVYLGIVWESLKIRIKDSKRFGDLIARFKFSISPHVSANDEKGVLSKPRRHSFNQIEKGTANTLNVNIQKDSINVCLLSVE